MSYSAPPTAWKKSKRQYTIVLRCSWWRNPRAGSWGASSVLGPLPGGEFYRLAVSPEVRRRGVARMLVDTAEKWMAEQGCHRITALVEKDHPWATGFWTAAGYELHESMSRYFRDV